MPFPGIMSALQGGGPQNITPRQGGGPGNAYLEHSMGGSLGRMFGGGIGSALGYTPGQMQGFQGMGGAMQQPGMGGLIGFIQRMLARRQAPRPPMAGGAPAAPMAPPGPQGIMAPQTGTGPPGAPGAVY